MIEFEFYPADSFSDYVGFSFQSSAEEIKDAQIMEGVELTIYFEAIEQGLNIMSGKGFSEVKLFAKYANAEIIKQAVSQYNQIDKCYLYNEINKCYLLVK